MRDPCDNRGDLAVARLLRPRSVAIVGVSADPSALGTRALAALERFGYPGKIHLVNPKRTEINGRPCLPSVDDLPVGVDVAMLAVSPAATLEAVAACARRQIGAAIIVSAGFSEAGEVGLDQQRQLAELARRSGIALLGPNCYGLVNFNDQVPLTSGPVQPIPRDGRSRLAVIAQSGGMMGVLIAANEAKGIPLSFAISTGNEAVCGVEDFLAAVIEDDSTCAIAIFVEQIRQPQRFLALARQARARGKAIVMLHSGRSERSREAARSHTGAMATDYTTMQTLVANEAVILVDDLDELIDTAGLLVCVRPPSVSGVGVITDSGAFKGLALDACEAVGVSLPEPSPDTVAALEEVLPPFAAATNPLDLTAQAMRDMEAGYGATIRAMKADPAIGSVLVALLMGAPQTMLAKAKAVVAAGGGDKPTILLILGDNSPIPDELQALVRRENIPFFRSPGRALRAISRLADCGRQRDVAAAPVITRQMLPSVSLQLGVLPEYLGKKWLERAGIPVPEGGLARTIEEAEAVAERIGYPVVLKAQAAALAHKSDVGGVAIGLKDGGALRRAWRDMTESVARARPDVALDGMLVERMSRPGLELVVGGRRDKQWGPLLMVGLGGVWIEVLKDIRFLPAECDEGRVIDELRRLKGAALLAGTRGAPAIDIEAVAQTVVRLGQMLAVTPEIVEIDVNPLVAYPAGEGVQALDALIVSGN